MLPFLTYLYIGLALFIIQPPVAAAQPVGPPEVREAAPTVDTLENGLRVIVAERRAARLAAIELRVRAGTAYETPTNNGVAHFLEHILFKGTATRRRGEVDAAVEAVGGELTAETGKDWARFATVVPAWSWRKAVEVLADVAQNPALRTEDIDSERNVILSEMAAAENDPVRVPLTAVATVAFPEGHPYRLPLHGTRENVRRFTRDDLLAFWRARYHPRNMSLIVVGDVKRAEIVGAARAFFQAPPNAAAATVKPDLPNPGPMAGITRAQPLQRDRNLVTVVLAFRAPSVKAPADAVAMDVLLNILASGSRGRLTEALVRTQNRALAVSADYLTQRAPGMMTLTAIGRQGTEKELEAALLAEIRKLREDGVTPAEVEAAKRALLSQVLFDEETYAGRANSLGFYDAIDTYDFSVQYPQRIRAVQPVDIGRIVQQYLTPNSYAIATVVPRRRTPPRPTGPDRSAEVTE